MNNNLPFRSTLFSHQDGIALGMILLALNEKQIISTMFSDRPTSIYDLQKLNLVSPVQMKIAIRAFVSQGWLTTSDPWHLEDMVFEMTERGRIASRAFPQYLNAAEFNQFTFSKGVPSNLSWVESDQFGSLTSSAHHKWHLFDRTTNCFEREIAVNCCNHLDGLLVVPVMNALSKLKVFPSSTFLDRSNGTDFRAVLELFHHLSWIKPGTKIWTQLGKTACEYARHYGLMGSYLPLMANLSEYLYRGVVLSPHNKDRFETHVDRELNVIASGAAHQTYFEDSEGIIIDIFNRFPIDLQPKFVVDMGCGDGKWLSNIYKLITTQTRRGQYLDKHPLLMVGADYNRQALNIARSYLKNAGVDCLLLQANISDPAEFSLQLETHGLDIKDGLHLRAFIDHNRTLLPLRSPEATIDYLSTGNYIDESGELISGIKLVNSLIEHLKKWAAYIGSHGLIIIESHTVDPSIAARHIGLLHNTAFDTYHGFSHQYPVEFDVFMRAAEESGFQASMQHQIRYPSSKPFVSISTNWFTLAGNDDSKQYFTNSNCRSELNSWSPAATEDIEDGNLLHRLLYQGGNIQKPRRWVAGPTGVLTRLTINALKIRIEEIQAGQRPPRLRIIDYGSGTGHAIIELIKACRQIGIFDRIEALGIDFHIYLADIPSGWSANGYKLLSGLDFVSFHSIRDERSGKFIPLNDITNNDPVDLVIASMVFHLIPPKALPRVLNNFTDILHPDGELLWNAPDIGPSTPSAELFHNPNRKLRKIILQCLDDPSFAPTLLTALSEKDYQLYKDIPEELDLIRQQLTPEKRYMCQEQADRQIRPIATDSEILNDHLTDFFHGEIFLKTFEIQEEDFIDTILVPSNQRYLAEIPDPKLSAKLSAFLMKFHVLPDLKNGPAATMFGINLQWTYGKYKKIGSI